MGKNKERVIKNIEWFIYGAYPYYKVAAKTPNLDTKLINEIVDEKIRKFGNIGNIPDINKKDKFLGIFPCKENQEYYGILYVHIVDPIKLKYNIEDTRSFFCFHCYLLKKEDVEKFYYNPFYLEGLDSCPSNKGKIEKILKNSDLKISLRNNFRDEDIIKLICKESFEKLKGKYPKIYEELERIIVEECYYIIKNIKPNDKVILKETENWEHIEDFFKYIFSKEEISKKLENISFMSLLLSSHSSFNIGGGVPGIIYPGYKKISFSIIKDKSLEKLKNSEIIKREAEKKAKNIKIYVDDIGSNKNITFFNNNIKINIKRIIKEKEIEIEEKIRERVDKIIKDKINNKIDNTLSEIKNTINENIKERDIKYKINNKIKEKIKDIIENNDIKDKLEKIIYNKICEIIKNEDIFEVKIKDKKKKLKFRKYIENIIKKEYIKVKENKIDDIKSKLDEIINNKDEVIKFIKVKLNNIKKEKEKKLETIIK